MSYGRIDDILSLALAMQGTAEGLSLEDIRVQLGCSRRTAERLRDVVLRSFPQAEEVATDERVKRWRVPTGVLDGVVAFTPEELVELKLAADELRSEGLGVPARACSPRSGP